MKDFVHKVKQCHKLLKKNFGHQRIAISGSIIQEQGMQPFPYHQKLLFTTGLIMHYTFLTKYRMYFLQHVTLL